jgi:hypothetical protein
MCERMGICARETIYYRKRKRTRNVLAHTARASVSAPTLELRMTEIILKSGNIVVNYNVHTFRHNCQPRYLRHIHIHSRTPLQHITLMFRLYDLSGWLLCSFYGSIFFLADGALVCFFPLSTSSPPPPPLPSPPSACTACRRHIRKTR